MLPYSLFCLLLAACYLLPRGTPSVGRPGVGTPGVGTGQVDKLECQYSYDDGDDMVFLNMESFEEVGAGRGVGISRG